MKNIPILLFFTLLTMSCTQNPKTLDEALKKDNVIPVAVTTVDTRFFDSLRVGIYNVKKDSMTKEMESLISLYDTDKGMSIDDVKANEDKILDLRHKIDVFTSLKFQDSLYVRETVDKYHKIRVESTIGGKAETYLYYDMKNQRVPFDTLLYVKELSTSYIAYLING
ncbi:MAG: hypothetical protein PHD21_06750 [Flavobacteriales bacterium]|nr:hypothetical protein [Flavobacteriales bacterium]